jgi:hypothetical protein
VTVPLRFAGYAAIFGKVDRGGDVIAPGAFAVCLARRGHEPLPLLWQHRAEARIGTIETIAEDKRGLRIIARIESNGETAGKAAELLAAGALNGLSFGYRVIAADGDHPRLLEALDIAEVSLVTHPMQPLARIHALERAPG